MVALRIFANLNMVWMLGSSVYTVIIVVGRSTTADAESTLWRKYEITVVMTLIGTLFPIAFEGLGMLENYHPRTTLRVQLARYKLDKTPVFFFFSISSPTICEKNIR